MTAESSLSHSTPTPPQEALANSRTLQVRLKNEAGRLLLLLPPEPEGEAENLTTSWADLWQQLKQNLDGQERFWQASTSVYLVARDRLLDSRQLQSIAGVLAEYKLNLRRIYTSRRQTAVAAVTAGYSVEQHAPVSRLDRTAPEAGQALAEPLYLQTTIRSGVEVRHPGTIIISGDVNPGGSAIADGDILIWGRLRGLAHAGASGNSTCRIMALHMEPTQLRIAEYLARAPETPPAPFAPEVAYIAEGSIRIAHAADFGRQHLFSRAN